MAIIMLYYLYTTAYGACVLAILALFFFVISRCPLNISTYGYSSSLSAVLFVTWLMSYPGLGDEESLMVTSINLRIYLAIFTVHCDL